MPQMNIIQAVNDALRIEMRRDKRVVILGEDQRFVDDPHWRDYVQFHEYFQGDTGRGLGASHQTGWTALITRCINMVARVREE